MAYTPLDQERKRDILSRAGPELFERMDISPLFMLHLVKEKVIFHHQSENIQALPTPGEQKNKLLDHLHSASIEQFIDFCIILHDVLKRHDIIKYVFGLHINNLRNQKKATMASEGASTPRRGSLLLWDKENQDEQEPVCDSLLSDALIEARKLEPSLQVDELWSHLEDLHVLRHTDVETLTYDAPRPVVVERLLNHLATSPTWKFHGLMRACVVTNQQQVIRKIGLNADDYIIAEESPVGSPGSSHLYTEAISSLLWRYWSMFMHWIYSWLARDQLLQATKDHSHNCKQKLMRRTLYDLGDSSAAKIVDVTKCYIELDTQQEGEDGNLREISESDILRCLPGETSLNVIRLYGSPGAGKTALARHIVYDWSLDVLDRLSKSLPLDHFTTMVYVPARQISSTVEKAIEEHLWCKTVDKQILLQHVHTGDGIGLVLDAIDEVRNPAVLNNIRKYIRDRQTSGDGPCVLITARTDLCELESSLFDRFLVVKGFSVPQAMEYIKSYFHGKLLQTVLEYVQAHQEKLYPVLTNPLRLHIFCALVSEGELELEENDDFSIFKLFVLLEQFLIRREGKIVTEEESHRFYAMCMFGLIHGLTEFPEQVLKKFGIPEGCLVFLEKADKERAAGRQVSYSFPHEMIYEFFAARYIETQPLGSKKSLILSVCSKPAFRNLQRIVFEVILQQELHQHTLLQTMLRAILILQHTEPGTESTEGMSETGEDSRALYDELVHLKTKVHPPESAEKLWREHQQDIDVGDVNDTWDRINNVFDKHPGGLKGLKWYSGLGNGVLGHAAECLQACPSKQREHLAKSTTEHLLPYDYKDTKGHHCIFAVGSSRWSEVVFDSEAKTIHVNGWSPEDVTEVLQQVRSSGVLSHYQHTFNPITLNMDKYQSLWGQPPSSAFTPAVCEGLTAELQHWFNICKSRQLVCSVGTSRYSEVFINIEQKTIGVRAWCVEDAKAALYVVRLSTKNKPSIMDSLSLDINNYSHLWGQPPSTLEVFSGLAAELAHYSCQSYHFVWTVGASRRCEVFANTEKKTIEVHAWNLEDAEEALHQVRLSTVYELPTMDSLTINTNKYRDIWGQPPVTPEVCTGLAAELGHWSEICKRYHFVWAVGASRYSEVIINTKKKTINANAWSVEDAKEVLHQVRLSGITSLKLQTLASLTLDMAEYWDLWGDVSSGALTSNTDSGLAAELGHWSDICKSYHLVWTVGASRYSDVFVNTEKKAIVVHAWNLEDAEEALHQVRLSTVYELPTMDSLTIKTNMYRDIWGQPPVTHEVCTGLAAELGHWSEICKSYCFVCMVGTSRWSRVGINIEEKTVKVHAYCMEDASEALRQVRLSGVSQLHSMDSLTIKANKYRELWGQPPVISKVWTAVYAELGHWSDSCKSYHFFCAVATSRRGEVVINTEEKTIRVQAVCLEDAKETLQQVRLSDVLSHYPHTFKPITLYIIEDPDVLGPLPSSACTPDVCKGLTAELQHWSTTCNSHHFVYSVGTVSYAEVVLHDNWITLYAWSVEHATEALYELRMSSEHLYHIQGFTACHFYSNKHHSLWGETLSGAFSQDTWRELFVEVGQWSEMYERDLNTFITLDDTTPLHDMILACSPSKWIVFYGTIDLQELYRILHTGQLKHVRMLSCTNIVVADSADKAALRDMREELVQAVSAGSLGMRILSHPQFVTQTGAAYQWNDGYKWEP